MRFWFSFLIIIFAVSLISFFLILLFLPPKVDGKLVSINLVYFFTSLIVSLALGLGLMLYSAGLGFQKFKVSRIAIRTETNRPKFLFRISMRRGVLFASLVCLLMLFRLLDIFNILNFLLLVAIVGIIEFYFSSR